MTSDIYNDVVNSQSDKLNAEIMGRINYMKTVSYTHLVGIYDAKYPLNVMAKEVERLEDRSKHGMYLYKMLLQKR